MSVRLLQLSDIHFADGGAPVDGRDPARRLRAVLAAARLETSPVDAVVLTGDLTDDGSRSGCHDLAVLLALLVLPILAVPGNHDDPVAVRDTFGPDVLEIGGWRIVGIDSTRPEQIHGTIDVEAEMSRLDLYDQRPTALAMHHPPVTLSTNAWFQLDGAAELRAAVARRPHIKALFTEHLHHPFEARVGEATLFGCPSSLIAFRHEGDEVAIGGADTTGARLNTLHDDGSVTSVLITA
nr:3',5'-cyclic-AMP phosphodiesterase [Dactylosporangium thailandense]